jgi:hypothetical protein
MADDKKGKMEKNVEKLTDEALDGVSGGTKIGCEPSWSPCEPKHKVGCAPTSTPCHPKHHGPIGCGPTSTPCGPKGPVGCGPTT